MRLPSPYVLPILLLALIGKVTDRPFITIAAICLILVLVCIILWQSLQRPLVAGIARWSYLRWVPWVITGIIIIGACAGLLRSQPQLRATYIPGEFTHASEITSSRG